MVASEPKRPGERTKPTDSRDFTDIKHVKSVEIRDVFASAGD